MTYTFRTKSYLDNCNDDVRLVKEEITICAASVREALDRYARIIKSKHYCEIIDTNSGEPTYNNPENLARQTGWIFYAEHETYDEHLNVVMESVELHVSVYVFADIEN